MRRLFGGTYDDQSVFITGHTGFVGSWLTHWLLELGARVTGYSLDPPSEPNMFTVCGLRERVNHIHGDIRDLDGVRRALADSDPQFVFHLAAQSLVRPGYEDPTGTFAANVMGTVNVLEAARAVPGVRACLVITSDKCYDNRETGRAFTEEDPLGGRDPYSASKACAEIAAAAYRESFFPPAPGRPAVATVRAGNILGGGDWGRDRLVPDCVAALAAGKSIPVRNPASVRPWQFITEPVSGYLELGRRMTADPVSFSGAWNFGPPAGEAVTVSRLVDMVVAGWGSGRWEKVPPVGDKPEAGVLRLDISRARDRLGWRPLYPVDTAVARSLEWYRDFYAGRTDMAAATVAQIAGYVAAGREAGQGWAGGTEP